MLIQPYLEAGRLRTVLDPFVKRVELLRILWPTNRFVSPKLRAFVEFMAGNFITLEKTRAYVASS